MTSMGLCGQELQPGSISQASVEAQRGIAPHALSQPHAEPHQHPATLQQSDQCVQPDLQRVVKMQSPPCWQPDPCGHIIDPQSSRLHQIPEEHLQPDCATRREACAPNLEEPVTQHWPPEALLEVHSHSLVDTRFQQSEQLQHVIQHTEGQTHPKHKSHPVNCETRTESCVPNLEEPVAEHWRPEASVEVRSDPGFQQSEQLQRVIRHTNGQRDPMHPAPGPLAQPRISCCPSSDASALAHAHAAAAVEAHSEVHAKEHEEHRVPPPAYGAASQGSPETPLQAQPHTHSHVPVATHQQTISESSLKTPALSEARQLFGSSDHGQSFPVDLVLTHPDPQISSHTRAERHPRSHKDAQGVAQAPAQGQAQGCARGQPQDVEEDAYRDAQAQPEAEVDVRGDSNPQLQPHADARPPTGARAHPYGPGEPQVQALVGERAAGQTRPPVGSQARPGGLVSAHPQADGSSAVHLPAEPEVRRVPNPDGCPQARQEVDPGTERKANAGLFCGDALMDGDPQELLSPRKQALRAQVQALEAECGMLRSGFAEADAERRVLRAGLKGRVAAAPMPVSVPGPEGGSSSEAGDAEQLIALLAKLRHCNHALEASLGSRGASPGPDSPWPAADVLVAEANLDVVAREAVRVGYNTALLESLLRALEHRIQRLESGPALPLCEVFGEVYECMPQSSEPPPG